MRLRQNRPISALPTGTTDVPPYWRLEFRAILVVMTLISVMVGTSTWGLVRIVRSRLMDTMAWETYEICDDAVASLRPALRSGDAAALQSSLAELRTHERRLAFAVVQNAQGDELAVKQWDAPSFLAFERQWLGRDPAHQEADLSRRTPPSRPTNLAAPSRPEAHVLRQPIFAGADTVSGPRAPSRSTLTGYLIVGSYDPIVRSSISNMEASALGVVCVMSLIAIPSTVLLMRRLTRPLRRITDATAMLAAGQKPPPLPVARPDEIGVLARSFNEMAERLDQTREELLQINEALEQQVMRRTTELRVANEMLAREIETKNEFLRTVSHDLHAPLRNISGMIELIRRTTGDRLPADVGHRLERISANVDMQSSMLGDLLELSRIRTRPGQCEPVDLEALMEQIIETFAADLATREIRCDCVTALPTVRVEFNIARQVFLNLIDNAIKYMGARKIRRIGIGHELSEGELRIVVADSGPGIPESERDRIFQVFRRGTTALASGVSGRGVGLAGVRMAVERWGGRVLVESNTNENHPEGTWSRFIVCIPSERIVTEAVVAADDPTATGPATGSDQNRLD